jgi:hypothetical protein
MKIKIKPLSLVLVCCLLAGTLHAQLISDIIYLKTGTVIKGMIVEQVPGKTIKVKTTDNLLIEINYQDIARIVKEETFAKEREQTGALSPQESRGLKKYFFRFNGGFYTVDAMGYVVGTAVGLRFGRFSVAATLNKTIADEKRTAGATDAKYDRLNIVCYGVKGFYTLDNDGALHPYLALGGGYGSSPYTKGKAKTGPSNFGYYDSYYINPSFGLDIPVGKNIFMFTELNYHLHRWGNIHQVWSDDSVPFRNAQIAYLLIGVKF